MSVNCATDMPMFQEDAVVVIKDLAYRVECTPTNARGKLIFHRYVLTQYFSENDTVTFHCIMSIPAKVKSVISSTEEDKTAVDLVECESIVENPNFYHYDYDAVNKFRYSSRIPDFNVEMAVSMIGEAHKRGNPLLKALCSEYLMENLTTQNVTEILKKSVESDTKPLLQKCLQFLSEQCKIIPLY